MQEEPGAVKGDADDVFRFPVEAAEDVGEGVDEGLFVCYLRRSFSSTLYFLHAFFLGVLGREGGSARRGRRTIALVTKSAETGNSFTISVRDCSRIS